MINWRDIFHPAATPNLPPLNQEQQVKLRLLSLLSFATTVKPLTYNKLMTALSISAQSELESLVINAIYSSLITARLSPATNPPFVNVTSVAPLRDVKLQSLSIMISTLAEWELRCGDVVREIEAEIIKIRADAKQRRVKEYERALLLQDAVSQPYPKAENQVSASGGGASMGNKREFSDDEGYQGDEGIADGGTSYMDIDETAGTSRRGANVGSSIGGGEGISRNVKRFFGRRKRDFENDDE